MTERDLAADHADPTTRPFWEAAREERLLIQHCETCDRHQLYPRPFCVGCTSIEIEWVPASGSGTVWSTTRVHLPADPALGLPTPYDLAIVELDEGPRLLTNLTGRCAIGDRVEVSWRPRGDQPPVPVFGPAPAAAGR